MEPSKVVDEDAEAVTAKFQEEQREQQELQASKGQVRSKEMCKLVMDESSKTQMLQVDWNHHLLELQQGLHLSRAL